MNYERKTRKPYGHVTWGQVLRYIEEYLKEHQFPPTYREIANAMEVRSTSTVAHHVEMLIARGLLSRIPDSPRTMVVTEKGRELLTPKTEEKEQDESAH